MLEGVGVSPLAERVFRILLRLPGSTTAQLADHADLDETGVSTSLEQLVRSGLVQETGGDEAVRRWLPLDPRGAVQALVRQRQEGLEKAVHAAELLSTEFAEGLLTSRRRQPAEVVDGEDRVVAAMMSLVALAKHDVAVLDAPPYVDHGASRTAEQSLLTRGVASRAVYSTAALEIPGRYESIRQMVREGEQARVLPTVPLKLLMVDGKHSLLPLSVHDGRVRSAIIVHPSMLSSALSALFDALWNQAMPLPVEDDVLPEGFNATDRRLVALLASGVKDEVIARELGISARTLGRRITRVMDQLGAASRFQAGAQAQRRGWL